MKEFLFFDLMIKKSRHHSFNGAFIANLITDPGSILPLQS